ncbi:hypothetical protein Poli38472_009395 [Pythium oligandrum]|uniref:Expansin-like EG45 domain-containing protein n=1 Tax=Pythium oligandrum TaxID=41045 RepID=A0A8K1CMW7_PYTOL|nr:hypothetical protein Poli38472_009395 [Pythium oligandrum]|eukprot:TMW65228.1 hypothetical protein Poli38472_009395 [Pythium oligandrum]
MRASHVATVVLAGLASVTADYFEGDGTAYTLGQTSAGNCNMMAANGDAGQNYAALNNEQWEDTKNCGRCAEVSCADARCGDKSTTQIVQILDRCPECKHGDLDLSPSVFGKITGSNPSRYKIRWRFVDCPIQGNIKYCLKGGSNNFWTAIQPTNVVSGVSSLKINGKQTKMLSSAYYYLLDGNSESQVDLSSLKVTITSVNGETIEDTVSLKDSSCTEGTSQFARGAGGGPVLAAPAPTPAPNTPSPTTATPAPTTTAPPTSTPASTPESPENATSIDQGQTNPSTPAPAPGLESGVVTDTTESGQVTDQRNADPPATNTGIREVNTRTDGSAAASPTIVAVAVLGAAALVALVVVVVIAKKKKKLNEKKSIEEEPDQIISRRAFDSICSPAEEPPQRMDFAVL